MRVRSISLFVSAITILTTTGCAASRLPSISKISPQWNASTSTTDDTLRAFDANIRSAEKGFLKARDQHDDDYAGAYKEVMSQIIVLKYTYINTHDVDEASLLRALYYLAVLNNAYT